MNREKEEPWSETLKVTGALVLSVMVMMALNMTSKNMTE